MIKIIPVDIGCEPSPSVPAETLIADGWQTFLIFFAVSKSLDETGLLKDLHVAVLECIDCESSKFGYPNDEGRPEHPLYEIGIANAESAVLEVVGSKWAEEVMDQTKRSTVRIWGSKNKSDEEHARHFIILLKEVTFECIAKDLIVNRFFNTFDEAVTYVRGKLKEH